MSQNIGAFSLDFGQKCDFQFSKINKSFDRYLAHQLDGPLPCWTPVPSGQDPPDFFLAIEDESYAVEVTSTPIARKPTLGKRTVNEETYEKTHREIVKSIEEAAHNQMFKGGYVVEFDKPIASDNFDRARKQLISSALDAISRSQLAPVSWSDVVSQDDRILCHLEKVGEGEIRVFEVFSTDFVQTDSPAFTASVTEILRNVIIRKIELLKAKGISQPAILLLLNTYGLADYETFLSCIEKVEERDAFQAIFIIRPNGSGCIVHSRHPAWPRGSGVGAA